MDSATEFQRCQHYARLREAAIARLTLARGVSAQDAAYLYDEETERADAAASVRASHDAKGG